MSLVIKFTQWVIQRIFKIYGYFSEICFRAFEIADALSVTIAANFLVPTAVNT